MAEPTPKIFETGAMKMEVGKVTGQSKGWGHPDDAQALGVDDAFPWLTFGNSVNIGLEEDKSVTTKAFASSPSIVTKTIENPLSMKGRYKGLDRFHYWFMGFENVVKPVVVFKSTTTDPWGGNAPTIGDTYSDGTNDFDYLRTEETRTEKLYVFAGDDVSTLPVSGDIDNGTSSFTFSEHSPVLYEHFLELDSRGRRYREYTAAERAALGTAVGDKRNLMATLGKRMANYDIRYANAIAKGFTFKVSSPGLAEWESVFMAFKEERGAFNSNNWSLLAGLCDNSLCPKHYEMSFGIGTTAGITNGVITGLTSLGLTDFSMNVETPLQSLQDFVSGLSIAEPVLEDTYKVNLEGTISRHTSSTYQEFRDAQTPVLARLAMNRGWYMQEFLFKKVSIQEAGPDDGSVAQEPLKMTSSFVCADTHGFADWVHGNAELHKSPVVFRVRNDNPNNEMLKY
jgi:hypothetical protein